MPRSIAARLKLGQNLHAVHLWHPQIHNDAIRRELGVLGKRLLAIGHHCDAMTDVFKCVGKHAADAFVVVDEKHTRLIGCSGVLVWHSLARSSDRAGMGGEAPTMAYI